MSNRIAPMQPYYIVNQVKLTPLQLEALTHFYQPITGPVAVSVYLTLLNTPLTEKHQSERYVHNQLIEQMRLTMHNLDDAIKHLEAIGLVKTYRDRHSHAETRRQTLYYQVIAPLDPRAFIEQSHLRAVLFNQIGPHNYHALLNRFTPETLDLSSFDEITLSFNQMYQVGSEIPSQNGELASDRPTAQINIEAASETFNYSQFLQFVMANHVDHSELTVELKENVLAMHQMFELNEAQMAEVVKLATNQLTNKIEQDKFIEIIQKRQQQNQSVQLTQSNEFPKNYTKQEIEARKQAIKQQYPEINDQQISIILLCEQMPAETFLTKTKNAKKGFPNDDELYFINNLQTRSNLSLPTINLLVYYLLVMQGQPNVYKGSLQRIANDWQQNELNSPETVFQYLNKQAQVEKIKQNQGNYRKFPNKKQSNTYSEPIPEWLQKQNETNGDSPQETQSEVVSKESQDAIRARLAALYSEEESN